MQERCAEIALTSPLPRAGEFARGAGEGTPGVQSPRHSAELTLQLLEHDPRDDVTHCAGRYSLIVRVSSASSIGLVTYAFAP